MQSQMKPWLAVVALMLAFPAHAKDKVTWDTLAAQFGCTNKVNEQHADDDTFYLVQYIPPNQTKKNWTRSFTVQLFRAPEDKKEADQYILNLIAQIPKNIESINGGDVTVWQSGKRANGPVAYGEFYIAGEHTATVVYHGAKGVIAVNQFAVRKGRLKLEEKQILAQLVGASIKPSVINQEAPPAAIDHSPAISDYPKPRR